MRMVWWRELKWHVASILILWAGRLTIEESSERTLRAFSELGASLQESDPTFNIVPLQRR